MGPVEEVVEPREVRLGVRSDMGTPALGPEPLAAADAEATRGGGGGGMAAAAASRETDCA